MEWNGMEYNGVHVNERLGEIRGKTKLGWTICIWFGMQWEEWR